MSKIVVTKNSKIDNREIKQKHRDLCENLKRKKTTGRGGENFIISKMIIRKSVRLSQNIKYI